MFSKKDDKAEPEVKLQTLVSSGDPGLVAVVKSILESADIPYMVKNEHSQNLFGFGNLGGIPNPLSGPIEIVVKEEDYETAKELISDIGC